MKTIVLKIKHNYKYYDKIDFGDLLCGTGRKMTIVILVCKII